MAQKQLDVLPGKGKSGLLQEASASEHPQSEPARPVNSKKVKTRPISSYSYRERIVHLLAVRPYKKMELQTELDRDGSSKRYGQCWTKALGKVSTFNPRGNLYTLKEICNKEVNENWPFYDEQQRDTIKRKLRDIEEGSISPGSSSSSGAIDKGSSGSSHALKRSASCDYVLPAKKQRIAHSQRLTMDDIVAPSSHLLTNPNTNVSLTRPKVSGDAHSQLPAVNAPLSSATCPIPKVSLHQVSKVTSQSVHKVSPLPVRKVSPKPVPKVSPQPVPKVSPKPVPKVSPQPAHKLSPQPVPRVSPLPVPNVSPLSASKVSPQPVPKVTLQPVHKMSPSSVPKVSPQPVPKEGHRSVALSASSPIDPMVENKPVVYPLDGYITNEELENLASVYGEVTDCEQRKKYKTEFEAGSREYNYMYSLTRKSVKTFTKLEQKLKAAIPSEIEALKEEIYASYLKLKTDGEYMSQRDALFRLKKKLDHIRTMVEEYDQRMLRQSS